MCSGLGGKRVPPGTKARSRSASVELAPQGAGSREREKSSSYSHFLDRWCLGALRELDLKQVLARLHAVFNMVQKVGGDSVQPIVQARGMPTR